MGGRSISASIGRSPSRRQSRAIFVLDLVLCRMRRPGDAEAAQALEANRDGAIASAEGHEEVYPQAGEGRQLGRADRAVRQFGEARFRFRQRAGEELAFGPIAARARKRDRDGAPTRLPATGPRRR